MSGSAKSGENGVGIQTVKRKPVRKCTGVFVSRLSPVTTVDDMAKHVNDFIKIDAIGEKLATKYNTYMLLLFLDAAMLILIS